MATKFVIFGNGLGMALNSDHFSLRHAMERVWASEILNDEEKAVIGSLKGIESETGPQSEPELLSTQLALDLLSNFRAKLGKDALRTWFTDPAIGFPTTLRKYIFSVANELFHYEIPAERQTEWKGFLDEFVTFIEKTRSHVATLNYDDLLYDPIVEGHCVGNNWIKLSKKKPGSGNNAPYLRDGFMGGKFKPETFDWGGSSAYLHLHGTPLFATKDDAPSKLKRDHIAYCKDTQHRHIVLASHGDKQAIIKTSPILSDYWDNRLPQCIQDATEIILVGYSGDDNHLNALISEKHDGAVRVVEWEGAGQLKERQNYWQTCLSGPKQDNVIEEPAHDGNHSIDIEVIQLADILTFRDWSPE